MKIEGSGCMRKLSDFGGRGGHQMRTDAKTTRGHSLSPPPHLESKSDEAIALANSLGVSGSIPANPPGALANSPGALANSPGVGGSMHRVAGDRRKFGQRHNGASPATKSAASVGGLGGDGDGRDIYQCGGFSPAGQSSLSSLPTQIFGVAAASLSSTGSTNSPQPATWHPTRGKRVSCHQCKRSMAATNLLYCSHKVTVKGRSCQKKYCLSCMARYGKSVTEAAEIQWQTNAFNKEKTTWKCPACEGQCTCAACVRRRHKAVMQRRSLQLWRSEAIGSRANASNVLFGVGKRTRAKGAASKPLHMQTRRGTTAKAARNRSAQPNLLSTATASVSTMGRHNTPGTPPSAISMPRVAVKGSTRKLTAYPAVPSATFLTVPRMSESSLGGGAVGMPAASVSNVTAVGVSVTSVGRAMSVPAARIGNMATQSVQPPAPQLHAMPNARQRPMVPVVTPTPVTKKTDADAVARKATALKL